nr:hypothetical protein [Tanacetum cinerariifolium]
MAPITFADTHNMIAFLTKSDASEGFDQIVDFLNAHTIQYALMVNPPIYVSCIKQFWASVLVKKTNDVVKLQALIDRKKVVVAEDTIRQDLRLDDADGVECMPNEEICTELARMGYEKPPPKLTFYKAFFSAQWKFLIHTIVQCMSAKRTAWNEFSSSMASAVICLVTGRKFNFSKYIFDSMVRNVDSPSKFLMYPQFLQVMINAQVDDLSSYTTKYTSPVLTQKVFANMRRIGKGFSGVKTPLFDTILVPPQADAENEDDDEVSVAPTPPSPTPATTPTSPTHEPSLPSQEPISSPPQAQPAPPSSPPQEQPTQPTHTSESSMTLLNTLMETCATLTQKVAHLEQDKVSQALEITKLMQRVKKLERKRRSKHSCLKRLRKGRMEEDVTVVKEINAVEHEPTVFDDEEVTMTMAQTLIKMKAEKARILDEQLAKRLQDEEIKQAAAREKQEKEDLKRAKMQEKHLDNIRKYQNLKGKPISVAQSRKNMILYLKNMAGYKIQHLKGMNYDQVRPIFDREYNNVQAFLKSDRDEEPTKKRATKETLLQESFKKLRAEVKVSGSHFTQQDTPTIDPTEMSEEDVQNMLQIIPVAEFKVEALHIKYPLIDWEIYSEGSRTY